MKFDIFLNKALAIHGNFYKYPNLEIVKARDTIEIICPLHGSYKQRVVNHLCGGGCNNCAQIKRNKGRQLNTKLFIEKAKLIHLEKYDYSLSEYIGYHTKLKIICRRHGVFIQDPASHLDGSGCNKCNKKGGLNLWADSAWSEAGKKSLTSEGFTLYLVRLYNENELFYKVGKTFNTVKQRFYKSLPYNYEIIDTIISKNSKLISLAERNILKQNEKYTPLIYFRGNTECLKKEVDLRKYIS